MYKNLIFILLFFSATLFTAQTKLSAAEIKAFTSRIAASSKNIRTLQADFVQTKKMDFLSKDIVSSGTLALQSPNTLSWKYSKPYSYSVVFKNGKMYTASQGKKSTADVKSKNFEKLNKLIVGSSTGNLFNDPEFNVSYWKTGNMTMARFVPKSSQLLRYIKNVELYFGKDDSTVSQVKMQEASGDTSHIVFRNTRINEKLPASAFTL